MNLYVNKVFEKNEFINLIQKEYRLKLKLDENNFLEFQHRIGNVVRFEYVYEEDNKIKIINYIDIPKVAPCVGFGGNIYN